MILKEALTQVGESYQRFVDLIPRVEARIAELEADLDNVKGENGPLGHDMTEILTGTIDAWKKVLTDLRHVRDRPKAMKLYYAKKVTKSIRRLRSKYPDE